MKDAITTRNIEEYIAETYGSKPNMTSEFLLPVVPLLQGDYGEDNDCTLTAITEVIHYLTRMKFTATTVYNIVVSIARKYCYRPSTGTFSLFVTSIMKKAYNNVNLSYNKMHGAYLKNVGFSFDKIKNILRKDTPMVLNLCRANDGYYHNHSVAIVGYAVYNNRYRFLVIHDNWEPEYRYIDYDEMNMFCSVNWSE